MKKIPYDTYLRWQNRRNWLYPSNLIDSSSQYPPMDREKWNIFMQATDKISEAQIKCELNWDQLILNLTSRGWKEEQKLFFKSPYDGKSYDIRDATILQKEKLSVDNNQ